MYKKFLDLLTAFGPYAWPVSAFAIAFLFRKQISILLLKIKKYDGLEFAESPTNDQNSPSNKTPSTITSNYPDDIGFINALQQKITGSSLEVPKLLFSYFSVLLPAFFMILAAHYNITSPTLLFTALFANIGFIFIKYLDLFFDDPFSKRKKSLIVSYSNIYSIINVLIFFFIYVLINENEKLSADPLFSVILTMLILIVLFNPFIYSISYLYMLRRKTN